MPLRRLGIWLARKPLAPWVRAAVVPPQAVESLRGRDRPLVYVLERRSVTDLLVLQEICIREGLPRPSWRLRIGGRGQKGAQPRSVCYLERRAGFCDTRVDRRPPALLADLVASAAADSAFDVDLVPVALYWGRAPQRGEGHWLRLMLAENWALAGRLRKFLAVLVNGRRTLLQFGEPMQLRAALAEDIGSARAVRRLARQLRHQLRMQRAATIGPDLSHRRTIVGQVLAAREVRAAMAQEMKDKRLSRRDALLVARGYANEIAANYSHAFVSVMDRLLTRLWNRLYGGVELHHLDTLQNVATGNELVYVPCHRSHMDYLLLSYIIYVKGFAVPHTAAGINLNLPVIGRLLRKGGAFFLRRSFRGNTLYSVVFMKYLGLMMARGHSLEYFIEGGRSRTGRLLRPKTGMLSMTVRSYLRDPRRPVVFVPVYFGYERLVEGDTYIAELSGRPKQKETVRGLLRSLPRLRRRFGKVHVCLGEPIALNDVLRRQHAASLDQRALGAMVDDIAREIMVSINSAAVITPVSLIAMTLLCMPRRAMVEGDLERQLDLYLFMLKSIPYSQRMVIAPLAGLEPTGSSIVQYGQDMQWLDRRRQVGGDVLGMSEQNAILATYFRNNVLHLFVLPSLVACCFLGNVSMRTKDLQRLARRIYPYIADELFMHWPEEQLAQVVSGILEFFARRGLLQRVEEDDAWRRPPADALEGMQLSVLAQATIQIIERYYLVVALLIRAGSGAITQEALVSRCQQIAHGMAIVYGLSAPEFFDASLFENFISLLRRRGVIEAGQGGRLVFDEVLTEVATDAQMVLSEQIRHSILQATH